MSSRIVEGWIVLSLIKEMKNFLFFEVRITFANVLAYYDSEVGTVGALLLMKGFFFS